MTYDLSQLLSIGFTLILMTIIMTIAYNLLNLVLILTENQQHEWILSLLMPTEQCNWFLLVVCSGTEEWYKYRWDSQRRTHQLKSHPPHGFNIVKGSTHVAVTRKFIKFALDDRRSKDLLNWMRDIHIPDEHFFQTLNHNPQLNIPGANSGINKLVCMHFDGRFINSKQIRDGQH
jgi:Core-2/I-Branching enzyme